jgi:nitrogen fixation protein NifZ
MSVYELESGDIVYAAVKIQNDGGIPEIAPDAVLAEVGTRGVLINTGHLEHDPDSVLFLVRFEDAEGNLGVPVGCEAEELSLEPA